MQRSLLRRLFQLSGVVPLGVFTAVHVASYATALLGNQSFGVAPASTGWLVLEALLVWAPLGYHAAYGLYCSAAALPSALPERQQSVTLRITGVLSFAFVAAHFAWLRVPVLSGHQRPEDVFQMLVLLLSSTNHGVPAAAALHLVGLGSVTLHLGLGLARFAEEWGIASRSRARRVASAVSALLFVLGAAAIVELATGSAVPSFLS